MLRALFDQQTLLKCQLHCSQRKMMHEQDRILARTAEFWSGIKIYYLERRTDSRSAGLTVLISKSLGFSFPNSCGWLMRTKTPGFSASLIALTFSPQYDSIRNQIQKVVPMPGKLTIFFIIIVSAVSLNATLAPLYNWTTIAGNAGYGSADGTNTDARFWAPIAIASDNNGNLYVSDYRNDTIRKLTPAGTNWVVNTLAGSPGNTGGADGTNGTARFNSPRGLAVDALGNVYVADTYNHDIRKLSPVGTNWVVTTIAGTAGSWGAVDGTNNIARFDFPYGVVVDTVGNVYVADGINNAIRKLTPAGTNWVVTTIAGRLAYSGSADGTNGTARFRSPSNIAMDTQGNMFVTDFYNFTVRKLTPQGTNWVVTTIAGLAGTSGSSDGTNSTARFYYSDGLTVDNQGDVFVADTSNHTLRQLIPQGTNWVVTTIAGLAGFYGNVDGSNSAARFYYPADVTVGTNGTLYIADDDNCTIRSLIQHGTNWVVGTITGSGGPGNADGTNNMARFNGPWGVAVNGNRNLFVVDQNNYTIRQLTPQGTNWIATTIAGRAGYSGHVDATNGDARFVSPTGIALDGNGNLFVADANVVRELSRQGTDWLVATINAAVFYVPRGVAVDGSGSVYVADSGNHVIRKLVQSGQGWVVSTIAGSSGNYGYLDGTNSGARFYFPWGVAVDNATNVYVVDSANNVIRKIAPVGTNWVTSTIAGRHGYVGSDDGTNSDALFWDPYGVAVDNKGVLYVTERTDTIRKISPVGTNWVVNTIGGKGATIGLPNFIGNTDGTNSTARFNMPMGVAVDSKGDVFVADTSNDTIRLGTPLVPTLEPITLTNGAIWFSWSTVPGQTYQLQFATDLTLADWQNFGNSVTASNVSLTVSDAIGSNTQRFYRVLLLQ